MDKNINKMETTQKETLITQNMLIAQFMEVKPRLISPDCYGLNNMPFWSITGDTPDKVLKDASLLLKYHNDWNQLMEVVDKIENYNEFTSVLFYPNSCTIIKSREFPADDNYFEISIDSFTKIEAVYNACVEFIKWYNKNK
jgi:hypothetical protein